MELDKSWSFIYPEAQFEGQAEKYGLYPIDKSPIEVTEQDIKSYYKPKLKEMTESK